MTWLRIDDRMATHPKIRALNDSEFRAYFRLLLVCSQHDDPNVDETVVAEIPGLTMQRVRKLATVGLLDETPGTPHCYTVHNWTDYRPKDTTAAERMRNYRERQRNDDRNGYVTNDVTDRNETVTRARVIPTRPEPSALGTSTEYISEGREEKNNNGSNEEAESRPLAAASSDDDIPF